MRPGRPEDLEPLIALWRREVGAGRQDIAPDEERMRRILSRFDWEARSRMVDGSDGLDGAVLLMSRPAPDGVIANMYVAGEPDIASGLARWGVQLSRAAGAMVTETFIARGLGGGLRDAGMTAARPWWRMDRSLETDGPRPSPVTGTEGSTRPLTAFYARLEHSRRDRD